MWAKEAQELALKSNSLKERNVIENFFWNRYLHRVEKKINKAIRSATKKGRRCAHLSDHEYIPGYYYRSYEKNIHIAKELIKIIPNWLEDCGFNCETSYLNEITIRW